MALFRIVRHLKSPLRKTVRQITIQSTVPCSYWHFSGPIVLCIGSQEPLFNPTDNCKWELTSPQQRNILSGSMPHVMCGFSLAEFGHTKVIIKSYPSKCMEISVPFGNKRTVGKKLFLHQETILRENTFL